MKILTGAQHAELDHYTIENEPIESVDLMERASRAIAEEIANRWDSQRTIYVFSGAGNNGGDGLAVARLLYGKGYRVVIYLFNIKGKLSEECEINRNRLQQIIADGGTNNRIVFKEVSQGFDFPRVTSKDVIIDALFGTGLKSPLQGGFAVVAKKINTLRCHVVSIDIPSGLMCEDNSYTDRSVVIHAELTLTIQLSKLAFLLPENEKCVGEWKTVDIGLSKEWLEHASTPYSLIEQKDVKDMLRTRSAFAHKGTMGHALLVAGSYGMAGASILAGRACLHSGIGKLSIHTCSGNNTIMQISLPEAVLIPDKNNRYITEVVDISRFQGIGIGPGLGKDNNTAEALQSYIAVSDDPLVLDADALNILGDHREWMSHIPAGSILTPHAKELENMTGSCANSYERLMHATDLATQYQIYVILKGHYSAICTPQGKVLFCPRGNAGMATPGSGDVLTGILTGLIAQGYPPSQAAILGVWIHGTAGDIAARELGEEYMLANDIVTNMSGAFRELKNKENQ